VSNRPIGFFDSGVGGLTVMREVADLLPNENLIYLGDTARLPYGTKSPENVIRFALENAEFLLKKQIKLLIISCHTACSHSFDVLSKKLSIPVIGVTQPGFKGLANASKTHSVAILGTTSTIQSGVFQRLLKAKFPTHTVYGIACPLFVPLVEDGLYAHAATKMIVEHYLASIKNTEVDTVLLACTHYPLLSGVIQEVLGPSIQLIEPARFAAEDVKSRLSDLNLLNTDLKTPIYRFFATDDVEKFRQLAKNFFPWPIDKVELA
jgi:glutamate racemase